MSHLIMIMLLDICLQDPRFYVYNSVWKLHIYEVVLLLYVFTHNIVVCVNILFNNKMLLYLEYNENRFKVVVFTEKPLLFSMVYFL